MRSSPLRSAVALVAAATTACGGGAVAERDVVEPLAARADRVAELADAGDGCGAEAELAALLGDASAARDAGELAPGVVDELRGAAERMREAGLACAADTEEDAAPADADADDEGKGRGKGKGKGKAKGKGR
jgi:hypothetical protein